MRISAPVAASLALAPAPRTPGRPVGPAAAEASRASCGAAIGSALPEPAAAGLAWLASSDPALAHAVSAQLPGARLTSARDLAAYVATTQASRIKIAG